MPSVSLTNWRTTRRAALDAVEAAHTTVHGTGPGRREATRQINHGYAVLLAAEFQGFCRELHTEAVRYLVAAVPTELQLIVDRALTLNRQLDRGNANPATLGSDFGRLGLVWWKSVDEVESAGADLRDELEKLNTWRNAVAHNDFDPKKLGGTMVLTLSMVRGWRKVCNQLAVALDQVLADHIATSTKALPW
jgi:hypothetical protein